VVSDASKFHVRPDWTFVVETVRPAAVDFGSSLRDHETIIGSPPGVPLRVIYCCWII
jgi:hypothetical protein